MTREEFLKKVDAGWSPPALLRAEHLSRLRLQIHALLDKILDADPDATRELSVRMYAADSLLELSPLIERCGAAAEKLFPNICYMVQKLIAQEADLAKQVAGAVEGGGLS